MSTDDRLTMALLAAECGVWGCTNKKPCGTHAADCDAADLQERSPLEIHDEVLVPLRAALEEVTRERDALRETLTAAERNETSALDAREDEYRHHLAARQCTIAAEAERDEARGEYKRVVGERDEAMKRAAELESALELANATLIRVRTEEVNAWQRGMDEAKCNAARRIEASEAAVWALLWHNWQSIDGTWYASESRRAVERALAALTAASAANP